MLLDLTSEQNGLSLNRGIEGTLVVDETTITEGLLHSPLELVALHRTPPALTLNLVASQCPWSMGTNDDDIGLITLAQETTLLYFEETSRLMSHQLYHPLEGKHALVYQFKHGDQGELNHRHARGSLGATSLLVFPLMGSMVGTYGGDSAVSQSLAQCRAVRQGLDGRVALDERLLGSIIRLGEIEVGNDSLARHRGTWRKEVELASRCDVSDMQTSAILMGQLHSQTTTLIAGLFAAYRGMKLHRGVVAIPLLEGCHIAVDDVGILAMSHQGQVEIVSCLEDAAQRLSLVDKHIASAGAHEELDTGNAMTVQLGETLHIVIGGTVEKA